MKYIVGLMIISVVGVTAYVVWSKNKLTSPMPDLSAQTGLQLLTPSSMSTLTLTSSAFKNGESIPSTYTCDGNNSNPPLHIEGVPEGAVSLVFIMDDPDAPNGTWDHWIKFNVAPTITSITENVEPAGVSGSGSGGENTYQGPCPHQGEHRYFFKLYALNVALSLPEGVTKKEVENAMQGHVLQEAQLMGTYIRK